MTIENFYFFNSKRFFGCSCNYYLNSFTKGDRKGKDSFHIFKFFVFYGHPSTSSG